MKKLLVMATTGMLLQIAAEASAAELPCYELAGFPISPHQWSVVGAANSKEQSPSCSLTLALAGMPASPHQLTVLTPRQRPTKELAAQMQQ
jgi:hypothetical protein